jgi:hypothetical protein
MDATAFLTPSDARLPEGWPNPRWRMTDPAAITARLDEDGRRIAAEKGDCTTDDLTRLGWRHEQVKARQQAIANDWDRLDEELARANETVAQIRADHAPREAILADDDIAFGIERAA